MCTQGNVHYLHCVCVRVCECGFKKGSTPDPHHTPRTGALIRANTRDAQFVLVPRALPPRVAFPRRRFLPPPATVYIFFSARRGSSNRPFRDRERGRARGRAREAARSVVYIPPSLEPEAKPPGDMRRGEEEESRLRVAGVPLGSPGRCTTTETVGEEVHSIDFIGKSRAAPRHPAHAFSTIPSRHNLEILSRHVRNSY